MTNELTKALGELIDLETSIKQNYKVVEQQAFCDEYRMLLGTIKHFEPQQYKRLLLTYDEAIMKTIGVTR